MEDRFHFEDLVVYQKALEYIDFVYKITGKFPKEERFVVTSNFLRAANSIALNIAEGSGGTKQEFKNFIRIAKRSIRECIVSITISRKRQYINEQEESQARQQCIELSKMLSGLTRSLDN